MSTLHNVCRAITVRQYERQTVGQPPLDEWWITEDTWEAMKRDAQQFMIVTTDMAQPNTCMGVTMRIIGS